MKGQQRHARASWFQPGTVESKTNMQITVVALMCHTLASIPQPVCREEIVVKDDMPMQACMLSQAALADWKGRTIYASEQWTIGRIKCVPGDYVIKGAA
jgi:hypothetical protein